MYKRQVLDIGSGLGYSSAVISRMADLVIAVEQDKGMATEAEETLSEVGADNVVVQVNKLEDGAPQHGPYDVIILQGGVEEIPLSILNQLKNGGRIGAVFIEEGLGTARIGYKLNSNVTWRYSFNATVPILEGFLKQKDFVL